MKQGVYKIVSRSSGRCYVGSSKDIEKRFKQHLSDLNNGSHHSNKLQEEFLKFGKYNLSLEVIEIVEDESQLEKREQYWIDKLQAFSIGLNVSPFSDRPRPLTPEEIQEISDARLNLPYKRLSLPPKSKNQPRDVTNDNLWNSIKSIFSGPIIIDNRTEYEKLCDETMERLGIIDGGRILVEFYQYSIGCRDIYGGFPGCRELIDSIVIKKYKMVDPETKQIICNFDYGEEQIRRWLRQNSIERLRNYKETVLNWVGNDQRKQNESQMIAMKRARGISF